MAHALIEAAGPFRKLLADRGYDAYHLRKRLAERKAEAVIPTTSSRKQPIPYDVIAYRQRNTVERLWARLKDYRRVATRYDKLAQNYLSGVLIAATVCYWVK
jgi:transposase